MGRHPSDLTDDQCGLVARIIPRAKKGGRPRSANEREVINGILYLVRTGCQWRQLPHCYPPWQTVYRYFARLQKSGAVRKLHRTLYEAARKVERRKPYPTAVVIDSRSVKTSKAGGVRGFDGGKRVKGRKRHIMTDTLGLCVDVVVTAANVHDTVGGRKVLDKATDWLKDHPKAVYADKGYQGPKFANWCRIVLGVKVNIGNNPAMAAKRFIPVKKRWVVERTFAWFSNYRRLDKDHERLIPHSTAMIRWSMIALMLCRVAPG